MERISSLLPDSLHREQDGFLPTNTSSATASITLANNSLANNLNDLSGSLNQLIENELSESREDVAAGLSQASNISKVAGISKVTDLVPAASEISQSESSAFDSNDLSAVWAAATANLQQKLDSQIYAAWIKPLRPAGISGPAGISAEAQSGHQSDATFAMTLFAPNKFCCEHIQRQYAPLIVESLRKVLFSGEESALEVVVHYRVGAASAFSSANVGPQKIQSSTLGTSRTADAIAPRKKSAPVEMGFSQEETKLNPNYNFSNFVVGSCNQFAHAASLKVSESPGLSYNPLFIYGGVGLGKTHLANAVGNAARRRKKRVLLTSSESFVTELITSLKSNNMERFRNKFRSLDVLIIDDIQFIIGKERTQEEFFHTFNELHGRHKQIIVTSDKLPQELIGLEERLRTRFASGLSVDLQAPDFETRVAILIKKAETLGVDVPDTVARRIAERIDTNVRELEGALNRLQALCSLHGTPATVEIADAVLRTIAPIRNRDITTETIQRIVASRFNVSVNDLTGKRRTHNIAFARQVAMYLCRRFTACSYPEIGALFGGRDHSTVIHAYKVVAEKITYDQEFQMELRGLEDALAR